MLKEWSMRVISRSRSKRMWGVGDRDVPTG